MVAQGTLPVIRRGCCVLGARGDGAGRAGILESEDSDAAADKLAASVAEHVTDADDRQWVEPRLAHLLGLADATFERDDLFAAWRLFFECLADDQSTVLVFEDLQWADAGLLDFIEYLVEWARSKPIFVLGLARRSSQDGGLRLEPRPAAASRASPSNRSPMRQWTPCSRGSSPAFRKS